MCEELKYLEKDKSEYNHRDYGIPDIHDQPYLPGWNRQCVLLLSKIYVNFNIIFLSHTRRNSINIFHFFDNIAYFKDILKIYNYIQYCLIRKSLHNPIVLLFVIFETI